MAKLQETEEALDAALGLVVDLKNALDDRRVSVDELVGAVSDGKLKESLRKGLEGLEKIPNELKQLNPWDGMMLVQRLIAKIMPILQKNG